MKNLETYTLKEEMREDLMQCYREVAPTCYSQVGAWKKTVSHPAKRYYITTRAALVHVKNIIRGDLQRVNAMKPTHRRMYLTIADEVMRLANTPQHHGKSLKQLTEIVLSSPAPEFFITFDYMRTIFSRMRLKRYDENGQFISYPENQSKKRRPYTHKKLKTLQIDNNV